jgi:ATP-dependent Clp protease ATP-binding subunit ClpB
MAVVRASSARVLNRVDEIILFHRLKRSEMSKIVDIQMARLAKLLEDRKITITLEPRRANGSPTRAGTRPMARARSSA